MRKLLIPLVVLVVVPPSALAADTRPGSAPIRDARALKSHHTTFTLTGARWAQVVGALAGTPMLGSYRFDTPTPSGYQCSVGLSVRSTLTRVRPRRTGNAVDPRPVGDGGSSGQQLRISRSGRHGGVTWWTGVISDDAASAAAYQRAPKALRRDGKRWIVHQVNVGSSANPVDEAACRNIARRTGSIAVLRVARTLGVTAGPPVSAPPYEIA